MVSLKNGRNLSCFIIPVAGDVQCLQLIDSILERWKFVTKENY